MSGQLAEGQHEEEEDGDQVLKRGVHRDAADESADSWVLDALVGFLKGPVWNVTIQAFIEQKSVVFEPEEDISEESAQEYQLIYEDFKDLVDRLLSGHMSDLGISAEQFEEACRCADGLLATKFRRVLFEQIWAANDYQIFVRFMTQRNIELQLQALEVLAQRFGLVYESFIPLGANRDDYLNDETVINEAIKRSLAEEEGLCGEDADREPNDGPAISTDSTDAKQKSIPEERRRLEAEHEREKERLSLAIQSAMTLDDNNVTEVLIEKDLQSKSLPKLKEESIEYKALETKPMPESIAIAREVEDKPVAGSVTAVKQRLLQSEAMGLSGDELRKRSDYLRKQRDKLLAIKKEERSKQLVRMEEQELLAKRPKSARAMRSVVELNSGAGGEATGGESAGDQSLAFRRSLAARLKAEVVEQQKH